VRSTGKLLDLAEKMDEFKEELGPDGQPKVSIPALEGKTTFKVHRYSGLIAG